MTVQMRVKSARRIMPKHGGDNVAGRPIRALSVFANASCGKGLQFIQRRHNGLFMRYDDAFVVTNERGNRNGFWRREVKS
ncbi:MAG: hypothetical protein JWM68_1467 [Verrucomicrobiales bacterium]|nr:hypothetical protein [Verrucomicrobiales bacterium]